MPEISAIRALRYNLGHVGNLSEVIAPPADAINSQLRDQLYDRNPDGAVRLIANHPEPGEQTSGLIHRATRLWRRWQTEGVVQHEAAPEVYIYHQTFELMGQTVTRRSILCGVRFRSPEDRRLYTALETSPEKVATHLELVRSCVANLNPIVGLITDPDDRLHSLLDSAIQEGLEISCVDDSGVKHSMWPVSDARTIGAIQEIVGPSSMLVVAGHHRLQASGEYLDWVTQVEGPLGSEHPANFVLAMLVNLDDASEILLPIHRVFHGTTQWNSEDLVARIGDCFTCNTIAEGSDAASAAWAPIAASDHQGRLALYCGSDQRWVLCEANEQAYARLHQLCPDASDEWCELSINLLHHLIIPDLLQASDASCDYQRTVDDLVATLAGEQECSFAAILPPLDTEAVETIAVQEERLPAAAFYVQHEPVTGLVFNPLNRR